MSGPRILLALGTAAGLVLPAGLSPLGAVPTAPDGASSPDTLLTGHSDNASLLAGALLADTTLANTTLADTMDTHLDLFQLPAMATAEVDALNVVSDPDFISNVTNFGLFTTTTAADPDDGFIAFVLQIPALGVTDILTSGADPEGNLDFGDAGIGIDGWTVNTLTTPIFDTTFSIPVEDPFADLFILLVQLGF